MLTVHKKQSATIGFALVVLLFLFVSGCAMGTTRVNINHEPINRVENKKEGSVLVGQFVDNRKDTQHIGNKRNGFGMVLGYIGTEDGVKLEALLTKYFAEALREAGYTVVIQEARGVAAPGQQTKFNAIVEGEIIEFWLDLYMKVWHNVDVKVRALDPADKNILWEKDIKGDQSNVLWIGSTGEFEKVISEALTKALNQAAKEFASDAFYRATKK